MDHQVLLVAGAGLAIVIAASVFSRRTGVATPLLLVGLGLAASYLPGAPAIRVEPELVLAGVLPLLLYSSAVNLPVIDVQRNFGLIAWLAVVMVVASAVVIGVVVHLVLPSISLPLAIALGATVSPTDAVAATAIGRRVGLPPRLMAILEGESLVNDGAALVTLSTAVAALTTYGGFSLGASLLDFVWAVLGALLVGFVVGPLTVRLRQRLDDPVLNTTISFAVPFLAYYPAEELGASGVLAVVVAGLVTGTAGSRRFSARDRQTQSVTWSTVSFVLESGLFLVLGYQLPGFVGDARAESGAGRIIGLIALVAGLLVVLRLLGVAVPALLDRLAGDRVGRRRALLAGLREKIEAFVPATARQRRRLAHGQQRLARGEADLDFEEREPVTPRGYLVLGWSGMRGVVTLAAAQTIDRGVALRSTVVLAAFGVALLTLVLFGLTLPALIRACRFPGVSAAERRDAVHQLLSRVGDAALESVGPVAEQTVDGEPVDTQVAERLQERLLPRVIAASRERREAPPGAIEQTLVLQRRYLDAMRDALAAERGIGAYSTETYRQVESLLDAVEQRTGAG